ncbi:MAG: tetratricopeptide repeat protein, partial [Planctomycetota bacterium]
RADADSLARAERLDHVEHLIEAGDLAAATSAVDQALADGLSHPRLPYLRARLLLGSGDEQAIDPAITLLGEAIAGAPSWLEPRLLLATTYLDSGRSHAAASVYADLESLFPHHPAGPYGRGACALIAGDDATAIDHLDRALELDPHYPPALAGRATAAERAGDHELHQQLLERYLGQRSDDGAAWYRLGALYARRGRQADARRAYRQAYRLIPDPSLAQTLADLARAAGDHLAAEDWLRRAKR